MRKCECQAGERAPGKEVKRGGGGVSQGEEEAGGVEGESSKGPAWR